MATRVKKTAVEQGAENPVYIPEIPSQMEGEEEIEGNISTTEEIKTESIKPDTDEITFLKKILHKQHTGCFGRHLDEMINERINKLKNGE